MKPTYWRQFEPNCHEDFESERKPVDPPLSSVTVPLEHVVEMMVDEKTFDYMTEKVIRTKFWRS